MKTPLEFETLQCTDLSPNSMVGVSGIKVKGHFEC